MNRTIIRLAVVAPLAASAVAFGASTAQAEINPNAPIVIGTPEQDPLDGPDDIAVPKPPKPEGPKDLAAPEPKPVVDPAPQGHGGGSAPVAGATTKASTGTGTGTRTDKAEAASHRVADLDAESRLGGTTLPTADADAEQGDEGGLSIVWLLAGGAVVTASGVAARKLARRNA
jgi:hypothetical protein